jgi:hypothetical protein
MEEVLFWNFITGWKKQEKVIQQKCNTSLFPNHPTIITFIKYYILQFSIY